MYNKFKVKEKLISIALALALAAQPLATQPMNVFAGEGKNDVIKASTVATNFDIANIIELVKNGKFNVETHVQNITPEGATVNYTVESQTAFSDETGDAAVLDTDGNVQKPGIAKVTVTVKDVSKETYVIADINGILSRARDAAAASAKAAYYAYDAAAYYACDAAVYADTAAASAAFAAAASAEAALDANGGENSDVFNSNFYGAADAADAALNAGDYEDWAASYKGNVDEIVSAIVADYGSCASTEQQKKDWLNAAYAAVKAAKKMSDGNGIDLEARLKIAYMAYRIAQFTWAYNTMDSNKEANAAACKGIAEVLQEVIDHVYSDRVGDIEKQADALP